MKLPEVRIRSSFLLNGAVIPLLLPGLIKSGHEHAADSEFINEKVDKYRSAWQLYEVRILTAMCEALGLEFKQNTIDVYVLPFHNSFSDPMVISTKYTADRFIEVFTHEITHRLLTDNNILTAGPDRKLLKSWKKLFGETHSFVTLVHIPVHAVLEYIFRDVLNEPERLERDIELNSRYNDYALAWDYVQEHGYENIIKQLREDYRNL